MRIQNNIPAYNAHRNYNIANNAISSSAEKLSSGYKINRAGDDAAGLAISEKMRAQIRGLEMASKNSLDAVSLIQTAEGALQSTHNILQRMRELSVQSASDTNEQIVDRAALDQEFQALKAEIDQIASATRFNDQNLIDGNFSKVKLNSLNSQLRGNSMTLNIGDAALGTYSFLVTTETVVAAVSGQAANSAMSGLVKDSINAGSVVSAGGSSILSVPTALTALFNGNYTLSVSNTSDSSYIEFKLTGDNGQVFTAKLDMTSANFATAGTFALTFGSGSAAIAISLTTTAAIGTTGGQPLEEQQLRALGDHFDGIGFTIAGGVDKIEEEKAFYATLTGAEKVKLEVGDKSVSFSNGITVNFNELTALNLDTSASGIANATAGYGAVFSSGASTIQIGSQKNQDLIIQVGANQGDELAINIDRMDASFLGVLGSKVSTRESASLAISQVNTAINKVSTQRAALGALQNRLNYKIENLDISAENLTAAESRIRDVDMAKEMTAFSKKNIVSQAATAMLAQANSLPQNVLQLLR